MFSIYIDNLSKDLGIIDFKDLFSSFGEVLKAYITNKFGRKSTGKYRFIKFDNIQKGMKVIEHINGKIVGDCKLQNIIA